MTPCCRSIQPRTPSSISAPTSALAQSPSGKAIKFQHRGAYDDIDSTYEAITAYLDEKGLEARNLFVEEYLNDAKDFDRHGASGRYLCLFEVTAKLRRRPQKAAGLLVQSAFCSAATMASPMAEVEMVALASPLMSAVRRPDAKTSAIAVSMRSAASPRPKE